MGKPSKILGFCQGIPAVPLAACRRPGRKDDRGAAVALLSPRASGWHRAQNSRH